MSQSRRRQVIHIRSSEGLQEFTCFPDDDDDTTSYVPETKTYTTLKGICNHFQQPN